MLPLLLYYGIIAQNMNGNIYYISNPNTSSPKPFPTNYYNQYFPNKVEYFDVFSPPITSTAIFTLGSINFI